MADGIVTLTTSTFDETVRASAKPILVDFWAEWCGPCKMIAPILGEIATEQPGLTIAKLNVDENPDIAMRFNVMSIPTLLVFDKGEVRKRLVGAKGKGQLLQELNEFLPYFPLTPGQRGEAIRDLQRRLGAAGFPPAAGFEAGSYCAQTERAVKTFQQARGLRADGECDDTTWTALVEASWCLGDRQLFLTLPHQRGDDVADLQSRLARLGFDSGRVDGILGPRTAGAIADFQSNCGLVADAMCGAETIRAIERVSSHSGTGPGVSTVRERERMRSGPGSVAHCRVVIGQFGGLSALTRTLARELRQEGATVMALDEPDAVAQALAANHFGADVYIGVESRAEASAVAHFYKVPTFESVGGRALAEAIAEELGEISVLTSHSSCAVGMRLPALRETCMPAVVLAVGPARAAADVVPQLSAAILRALQLWISRAA